MGGKCEKVWKWVRRCGRRRCRGDGTAATKLFLRVAVLLREGGGREGEERRCGGCRRQGGEDGGEDDSCLEPCSHRRGHATPAGDALIHTFPHIPPVSGVALTPPIIS